MRVQCRGLTVLAVLAAVMIPLEASLALPVPLASSGFEVAQGYPAPPAYYDVRTTTLSPDAGLNWAGGWVGSRGGAAYTYVESNGTAYSGDQHLQMSRPSNTSIDDMYVGRKFDASLVQENRLAFECAIRLNTNAAALAAKGNYFAGNGQLYLEHALTNSTGDENIRLEFSRSPSNNGFAPLVLKGAGALTGTGTKRADLTLGNWDDPAGSMYAKNTWLRIKCDMNLAAQQMDLYMNDVLIGNYPFQNLLAAGVSLDKIRYRSARGYGDLAGDGTPLWPGTGFSIDDVAFSTLPEPATFLLIGAAGCYVLRPRRRT